MAPSAFIPGPRPPNPLVLEKQMQKIVLTYGTIAGSIIIGSIILSLTLGQNKDLKFLEWLGYLIMILALSMIFVAIKKYRDRDLGGTIRFTTATQLGLGITLVASLIYVVTWEVNLMVTDHAFIHEYTAAIIEGKKAEGLSGAELDEVVTEMDELVEKYGNPLFRMPMTFLEIFPVGLLVTLLAAGLLRNDRFLPA